MGHGRRFIPACAGNSYRKFKVSRIETVHPRLRGELAFTKPAHSCGVGSSPLARGTQIVQDISTAIRRFIPACAGNSRRKTMKDHVFAVHPRLRGELGATLFLPFFHRRFIPACAGNSRIPSVSNHISGGSSPLARGTHFRANNIYLAQRFIPACAGNSLCWFSISQFLSGSSPLARGTRH